MTDKRVPNRRPGAHMSNQDKTANRTPWEEFDDDLDESNVRAASAEIAAKADEASDLQMISIRLQRPLLAALKSIASHHKVGYQPLIRDLLLRFAISETKMIQNQVLEQMQRESEKQSSMKPVDDFLERKRREA